MGKTGAKLPGLCLTRIGRRIHVRSPPPLQPSKSSKEVPSDRNSRNSEDAAGEEKPADTKPGIVIGRKIMIVVDSSIEAKGAIQWALSHTVQNQDTVILLYVSKPLKHGKDDVASPRVYQLLCSMKNLFHLKKPEVQVQIEVAMGEEGKEKGAVIVEQAKKQGVALLVLGQRKRCLTWRLLMMWAGTRVGGSGGGGGTVEYCVQNAECMAIAVRRNSSKTGGYFITTKRHKDFWLLA